MKSKLLPCFWHKASLALYGIILPIFFYTVAEAKNKNSSPRHRSDLPKFFKYEFYPLQDTVIKGKITDENGVSLAGVSIVEKGGTSGVTTDANGDFSLSVKDRNSMLVISFVGYTDLEINASSVRAGTAVKLESVAKKLEDVIVVGYGTQRRSELTNAVVQTTGTEIKRSNNLSVSNSLSGRLPGLFVTQQSAVPGFDDAQILVRGAKTYRNTSALIVIDGVANADPDGLNRLDPNDIESISVLKDASAAIYGAQSAGGVVLVTTKRGRVGKPSVDFSTTFSYQSPTMKVKSADVFEYMQTLNDRRDLEGTTHDFPDETFEAFRNGSRRAENWYNALVDPPAKQNRQSVNLRGGTEQIRYFLSVGTAGQGGILRADDKTKLRQYNVRANLDVSVTKNFEIGLDFTAREKSTETPQSSPGGDVGAFASISPLQEAYIGGDYRYPGEGWSHLNPAARLLSPGYRRYKADVVGGTFRFKYNLPFVKGLTLDGFSSIVKTSNYDKVFNYTWVYYERDAVTGEIVQKQSRTVEDIGLREDFYQSLRFTNNIKLSYNTVIADKHKIKAFVAYEQMDYNTNSFWAQRLGFDSPLIDQLFAGSTNRENWNNNGTAAENARRNYFGRVSYEYNNKYLVGFSARYDGSPIFPKDRRYGFFPQASAAWIVSNESFIPQDIFSNFKIRASWGQLGNDRVNPFQYIGAYGYAPGWVVDGADARGIAATSTPNPNITWEVSETSDIGFEFGFMKNRLTFEADFYKTTTSDILGRRQASIPDYTGLVLPDENIGKMDSKGFELQANYRQPVGPVSLRLSANFSYTVNKIIYFDETPQAEPYQKLEGQPLGSELVYKSIGIYRSAGDLTKYTSYPGAMVGGLIFGDLNNDGEINSNDRYMFNTTVINGNVLTPYQFGFSIGADYKAFDLNILLQGQSGAKWRLSNGFSSAANGNGLKYVANNSFTLSNAEAPLPMVSPIGVGGENSDFYYHKASWLRFKSVALGYTLQDDLLKRAKISALRIYVAGDNLFLLYNNLKKYGAGDPEFATVTGNGGTYPNMRTFSFGINLTF